MNGIRVGLIGYGSWTRNAYLPALKRDGRAVVVSVAARSETTRIRAAAELGQDVALFDSARALLSGPAVDAVMIAVPDAMHEEALTEALNAEVAVLYEPPVSDARSRIPGMLKRLIDARHVTHADLELAYIPAIPRAAELAKSGALGRLQAVSIRLESGWGPVRGYDLCNIHHMAPWYVDVLNHITGSWPERVLVIDGEGVPGRRQSQGIGHFDYNGVRGTIQANIASVGDLAITIEVNGDDGDITINVLTGELRLRTRSNPEWSIEARHSLKPYADWPGMHESVSAFLTAVESGKETAADAKTVARLHCVGLAADRSKDSGTWETIGDISTVLT